MTFFSETCMIYELGLSGRLLMLEPECFGCRYPGWISAGWTCEKNLVMVDDRM